MPFLVAIQSPQQVHPFAQRCGWGLLGEQLVGAGDEPCDLVPVDGLD
jgi:hypothetical protein